MNQDRFDDLARALAGSTSRRAVLRTLAAGVVAVLAGAIRGEEVSAEHCQTASDCHFKGDLCCNGLCEFQSRDNCGICGNICTGLTQCCGGKCLECDFCCSSQCVTRSNDNCATCGDVCTSPQACCREPSLGWRCRNLQTDNNNCGACGTGCGGTCVGGQCTCPAGQTACSGFASSGGASHPVTICCGTGATCFQSAYTVVCKCPPCQFSGADRNCHPCADQNGGKGCCFQGKCEDQCPGCTTCESGTCTPDNQKCSNCASCSAGDGMCHDLDCGASGLCCSGGHHCLTPADCASAGGECEGGICKPKKCTPAGNSVPGPLAALADAIGLGVTVAEATTGCGPCETCSADHTCVSVCNACQKCDTTTSATGTCVSDPAKCNSAQCLTCSAGGTCASTCGPGQTCCSAACINAQTDAANCGACGNACPSGQTCVAGACVGCNPPCLSCETCVGGVCHNACPNAGEICVNGSCVCDTANCYSLVNGACVFCPGFVSGSPGVVCQLGTCNCDSSRCYSSAVNVATQQFYCVPYCTHSCEKCNGGTCNSTCMAAQGGFCDIYGFDANGNPLYGCCGHTGFCPAGGYYVGLNGCCISAGGDVNNCCY